MAEKARLLQTEDAFSHFRAVAVAAEGAGKEKAIGSLDALLKMPGMRHHAMVTYAEARRDVVPGWEDTTTRNRALKDLFLAGALYRCGDKEGIGQTLLERYAVGLQAHYARYAYEVLQSKR